MIDKWTGPVKFQFGGNEYAANALQGVARKELGVLRNLMSFQNLQQDQRTVRFDDGTTINVQIVFGQARANIFVPVHGHRPEELTWPQPEKMPEVELVSDEIEKEEQERELPNIISTTGTIVAFVDAGILEEINTWDSFWTYGGYSPFQSLAPVNPRLVWAADRSDNSVRRYKIDCITGEVEECYQSYEYEYPTHGHRDNQTDNISVSACGLVGSNYTIGLRAWRPIGMGYSYQTTEGLLWSQIRMYKGEAKKYIDMAVDPTDYTTEPHPDPDCGCGPGSVSRNISGTLHSHIFAVGDKYYAIVGSVSGSLSGVYEDDICRNGVICSFDGTLSFSDSIDEFNKEGNLVASRTIFSGDMSYSKQHNRSEYDTAGTLSYARSFIPYFSTVVLTARRELEVRGGGTTLESVHSVSHNNEGFLAKVWSGTRSWDKIPGLTGGPEHDNLDGETALAFITFTGNIRWEIGYSWSGEMDSPYTYSPDDPCLRGFVESNKQKRSMSSKLFASLPYYHRDDGEAYGDGYIIDLDNGSIVTNFASIGWIQDKSVSSVFFIEPERLVVVYSYRDEAHELYGPGKYYSIFDKDGNREEDDEGNVFWEWTLTGTNYQGFIDNL